MKPIIDSHCHIDMVLEKGLPLQTIADSLQKNNIHSIVQIGTNAQTSLFSKKFAHDNTLYSNVYYTIGCHPLDISLENKIETDYTYGKAMVEESIHDAKFVAIGEIGLDFYYQKENQKKQEEVFQFYLELAKEYKKPVCIHTRSAHAETVAMLKDFSSEYNILIHCFTGNLKEMMDFLDIGCFISFSGIVTFQNAKDLQYAATICPLEKMIIETDSPFLTPAPHRGKINHPGLVRHVLNYISELKKIDTNEIADITFQNTKQFYNI